MVEVEVPDLRSLTRCLRSNLSCFAWSLRACFAAFCSSLDKGLEDGADATDGTEGTDGTDGTEGTEGTDGTDGTEGIEGGDGI